MTRVNKGSATKAGKPYLACTRAKSKAEPRCLAPSVRLELIEAALRRGARDLVDDVRSAAGVLAGEIQGVEQQMADVKQRMARVIEAIELGDHDDGDVNRRWKDVGREGMIPAAQQSVERQTARPTIRHLVNRQAALAATLDELAAELDQLVQKQERANPRAIEEKRRKLLAALKAEPPEPATINVLLRQLFETVTVQVQDSTLTFLWKHGGMSELHYGA